MHEVSHSISHDELNRLRDLRATTMLRLAADRIHRNYVGGTLDPTTRDAVEAARDGLARLGNEIAREKSAKVVSDGIGGLANALDTDDHVAGQREIAVAAPTMVAMALLSDWEVGSLNPF